MKVNNENPKLKDKITSLEETVNPNEQVLLSCSLEVHGVPFFQNENLSTILESIAKELNVDCNNHDLVNIYRIRKPSTNTNSQLPPIIVAKLTSQKVRDAVITNRKKATNFTVSKLGLASGNNSIVYIRETLTPANRMIYSAALNLRKNGKMKYLWISEGIIFCKKEDGTARIQLHNMEALSKLQ